jgi:hypothetical protein
MTKKYGASFWTPLRAYRDYTPTFPIQVLYYPSKSLIY